MVRVVKEGGGRVGWGVGRGGAGAVVVVSPLAVSVFHQALCLHLNIIRGSNQDTVHNKHCQFPTHQVDRRGGARPLEAQVLRLLSSRVPVLRRPRFALVVGALPGRRVQPRGSVLVVDAGAGAHRVAGPAPGPGLLAPGLLTHLVPLLQRRQADRARLLAGVADLKMFKKSAL